MVALKNMKLRHRFTIMLGGMAVITFALFFCFSLYSQQVTKDEFAERSTLLAETIGSASALNLVMQDNEGLNESLTRTAASGNIVAGGFFDSEGTVVAEQQMSTLIAPQDRLPAKNGTLRWTETTRGEPIVIAHSDVRLKGEDSANGGDLQGSVLVAVPAQSIEVQKRTSMIIAFAIPTLIALLVWLVLRQVQRTVVRPVEALKEMAGAVENGDLTARVDVSQQDEIGELSASLNTMVDASEQSTQVLEEQKEHADQAMRQSEELKQQAEEERQYLQEQFRRISAVIAAVTHGDLTQRLIVDRDDEVGAMMQELNQMIDDNEALIGEVKSAGNEISIAAYQVASAAEEMSAGSKDQASQTIEVAAAIEEMSATIAESSRNAYEANEMAQRAAKLAGEGEQVFKETTGGMMRIATIVKDSAEKVSNLGESSVQIGEIIQVIGDIADQTNLLALNAAIEAARAGEQGRGFAVVADEVRKLAERTTDATKQIGDMITRIQHNTGEVVEAMKKGNEEVENGLTMADDATRSLAEIIDSIDRMVEMIDQIAAASQQQSTASSQISQNVEAISSVATEVSNATSELAFTAENSQSLSGELGQLIERFKIREAVDTQALGTYDNVPYPSGDGAESLVSN